MASKQISLNRVFGKDGFLTPYGFKQGNVSSKLGLLFKKEMWFQGAMYYVRLRRQGNSLRCDSQIKFECFHKYSKAKDFYNSIEI